MNLVMYPFPGLSGQLLFLDEPTSGLDSYSARMLIEQLRAVAHDDGRTVLCTIHQPSSEVFALFDTVIVLTAGEVFYHGLASGALQYADAILQHAHMYGGD